MIYICTACKYTFSSDVIPDRCPDCGKQAVRPAMRNEVEDYERIQRELRGELDTGFDPVATAHCATP